MKKKSNVLWQYWTLRFSSTLTWRQPPSAAESKSFSFNHAINISILYCSERFIICGTVLEFSVIIHYELASLFYLKNQKKKIFGIWHLNDL